MDVTTIRLAEPAEFETLQADMVQVYLHAFRDPPYSKPQAEVDAFAQFLPRHMGAAGFRLAIASHGTDQKLLGFAYGRTPSPGQPWYDIVENALRPTGTDGWLTDAYQLAEMAVIPGARGQGVGGALHDRLFQGLPHKQAVLTTMAGESPAYRFYLSKGWKVLLENMVAGDLPRCYRVMALELESTEGHRTGQQ